MSYRKGDYSTRISKIEESEESFLNFKYELTKIFHLRNFVNDRDDFWLFTKKYETIQRKARSIKKNIGKHLI